MSCRRRPSSLYTFPLAEAWLGIASEGFPDFEQFCSKGFPKGTQSFKSDAFDANAFVAPPAAYATAAALALPPN